MRNRTASSYYVAESGLEAQILSASCHGSAASVTTQRRVLMNAIFSFNAVVLRAMNNNTDGGSNAVGLTLNQWEGNPKPRIFYCFIVIYYCLLLCCYCLVLMPVEQFMCMLQGSPQNGRRHQIGGPWTYSVDT